MKTKSQFMEEMREKVRSYFNANGATLHIDTQATNIDQDGIHEYLYTLIQDGLLNIPGFKLQGYSFSAFDTDHCIHNFYYELNDHSLNSQQILEILKDLDLLSQDDSQPKPMYTFYGGSLYITIIGEA